jgi:hypothetical protein
LSIVVEFVVIGGHNTHSSVLYVLFFLVGVIEFSLEYIVIVHILILHLFILNSFQV